MRKKIKPGILLRYADKSPENRLFVNCFLAEQYYLPLFPLTVSKQGKSLTEDKIAKDLSLYRARDSGVIKNFRIIWSNYRHYPMRPLRIRLLFKSNIRDYVSRPLITSVGEARVALGKYPQRSAKIEAWRKRRQIIT